ncbi:MAG TPA: DUF3352 domain-containing protein [Chloroflexia bacterium]|nr:DUF3352 domain-containing protein [Chloroflexia bacterium]
MDASEPGRTGRERDPQKGDMNAPSAPEASSSPSHKLGDTQPFRPVREYRPLTSEPALEEDSPLQQTAPYRPVRQQVNVSPKKGVSLTFILALLALLLVAVAVAAYFIIRGSGGAGGGSVPVESALPANTLGYFSINPAPAESQSHAFEKLRETFESQPGFHEAMTNLVLQVQGAISSTGLPLGSTTDAATLDTLAGYLGGGVTIAVLAPSQGDLISLKPSTNGDISPLAAFDVLGRNVVGLVDLDFTSEGTNQGFIADLRAVKDNLDKAKVVESYHGTDIRQYAAGPLQIYFALLGGTSTAAVGINSVPVKVLIDELRANKGLKEDEGFKRLSGKVPAARVATLYLNLGEIDKALKVPFPRYEQTDTIANTELSGLLKLQGTMLITLSARDDGVQIDSASQGFSPSWGALVTGNMEFYPMSINASARPDSSTLDDVPTDAITFLVGTDLKTAGLSLLDSLKKSGTNIFFAESDAIEPLGLSMRNDILELMPGDFSITLQASDIQPLAFPPAVIAQLKLSDSHSARVAENVKRGVEKMSEGKAQPFDVAGGMFYPTSSDGPTETIIGVAKERFILSYDKDLDAAKARAETALSNLGKGFGTTDKWKGISTHLPPDSNLIGYFDLVALREMYEQAMSNVMTAQAKEAYEKELAPLVKPLKYALVGLATEPTKEGEASRNLTRIFLGIGK